MKEGQKVHMELEQQVVELHKVRGGWVGQGRGGRTARRTSG